VRALRVNRRLEGPSELLDCHPVPVLHTVCGTDHPIGAGANRRQILVALWHHPHRLVQLDGVEAYFLRCNLFKWFSGVIC
jgi:hypothetical protein